MPNENVRFRPRNEILSFEEIERFVRVVAQMGVHRLRLTGGEPLVRAELPRLVEMLSALPGIDDLALTTNGILLEEQAADLRRAGLERVNISLDTLSEETFKKISRREGLDRVLAGIAAAQKVGFKKHTAQRDRNSRSHGRRNHPLARFSRERGLELRFIEYCRSMPKSLAGRRRAQRRNNPPNLEAEFGPLVPVAAPTPASLHDFEFADGRGRIA